MQLSTVVGGYSNFIILCQLWIYTSD